MPITVVANIMYNIGMTILATCVAAYTVLSINIIFKVATSSLYTCVTRQEVH